ncbi:MAG: HAD family phosphatase [Leptolyngbya sp. SIO1E4]|nr:HAD family phosphatase [Leptolyngbya sp. SIO1E4]
MENSPAPYEDFSPSTFADIRLVATDMDGTLTDCGQFTPALIQALQALAAADITPLIVTGRSTGWVQGLVAYLPIVGAIAENGGVFIPKNTLEPAWLVKIPDMGLHRTQLAAAFAQIQQAFPNLHPSADNGFRLTDWTFDISNLNPSDLQTIDAICRAAGWGFTYSAVQCHIRPAAQDKGIGLKTVLTQHFPQVSAEQVVTVGDSPNDEGLFNPELFPLSVGVANVAQYRDRLRYLPALTTQGKEVQGFQELVQRILAARHPG